MSKLLCMLKTAEQNLNDARIKINPNGTLNLGYDLKQILPKSVSPHTYNYQDEYLARLMARSGGHPLS